MSQGTEQTQNKLGSGNGKTILTAFNSDPFITLLFKKSYDIWKDEIDEVIICHHGENKEINEFNATVLNDKKCRNEISRKNYTELGQALDSIYKYAHGDVIVTIDSDNFIFKKGVITKYANYINDGTYDAIGTAGMSTRPLELGDEIRQKCPWGFVRFNSFLSFWNKEKLDIVDTSFKRKLFKKGKKIDEIGYTFSRGGFIDTMGFLTIKFLSKYKNYRVLPRNEDDKYQHIGGMSKMSRILLGENNRSIYGLYSPYLNAKFRVSKIAWHMYAYLNGKDQCPFKEFGKKYLKFLEEKIKFSQGRFDYTYADVMKEVVRIGALWR